VVDRIVVMRRGKVVAANIDPKQTSVAEVEDVITGDLAESAHQREIRLV
jgi:simple sugar transport system ATP-binding protein